MCLYRTLAGYSNIPAPSGHEHLISTVIEQNLRNCEVNLEKDELGNILATKRGRKRGTVVLCAHQDKIVYSNHIGPFMGADEDGYKIRIENEGLLQLFSVPARSKTILIGDDFIDTRLRFCGPRYTWLGKWFKLISLQKRVKNVVNNLTLLESPVNLGEPNEQLEPSESKNPRISELENRLDALAEELRDFITEHIRIVPSSNGYHDQAVISHGTDIYFWPRFKRSNGLVRGKLDDTIGLSIVTEILRETDPSNSPTLIGLFTVSEEVGGRGAKKAAQYLNSMPSFSRPDRIIVIDTTRFGKVGNGPVLYLSCGGVDFDPNLIEEIAKTASDQQIPLSQVKPMTFNDSTVLGSKTEIPTVAIEVPIKNMHSERETASVQDINRTFSLIKAYINNFVI